MSEFVRAKLAWHRAGMDPTMRRQLNEALQADIEAAIYTGKRLDGAALGEIFDILKQLQSKGYCDQYGRPSAGKPVDPYLIDFQIAACRYANAAAAGVVDDKAYAETIKTSFGLDDRTWSRWRRAASTLAEAEVWAHEPCIAGLTTEQALAVTIRLTMEHAAAVYTRRKK